MEKPMVSRPVLSLDITLREGPLIVTALGGGSLALWASAPLFIAVPTALAIMIKLRITVWRQRIGA